jgi:hypothetical protein
MDKENEAYIQNRVLFSHKEKWIMLFAGKYMELEIIMLSEINKIEKDLWHAEFRP